MSDIDLAVTRSQRLERMLEREFAASGKGRHQKISSVEDALPEELTRKLRLVATVRNKVVHESGRIEDKPRFLRAADEAEQELAAIVNRRGRGTRGKRRLIVMTVAIIVTWLVLKWLW